MDKSCSLILGLLTSLLFGIGAVRSCKPSGLVKYNLTFEGHWSDEDFPKQYPRFRPHAQFSKLIGRSHTTDYSLFHIGDTATSALKDFAQVGSTVQYDKLDHQGKEGLLDLFQTTAITEGVGVQWTTFFADDDHTLISFASKIVPSPDWFVGGDSISLCSNDQWVTEEVINLFPIDAGTDKGFTFTSPNWEENPLLPISEITSQYPSHEANSFYYPKNKTLPILAKVIIQKLEEYESTIDEQEADILDLDSYYSEEIEVEEEGMDELYEENENGLVEEEYDPKQELHRGLDAVDELQGNVIDAEELVKGIDKDTHAKESDTHFEEEIKSHSNTKQVTTAINTTSDYATTEIITSLPETTTENDEPSEPTVTPTKTTQRKPQHDEYEDMSEEKQIETNVDPTNSPTDMPLNDFIRGGQLPINKHQKDKRKNRHHRNHGRRDSKHDKEKRRQRMKERVDCELGDWGEWSPCSVSCGYGTRTRVRMILQQPRNGGRPCRQYPEDDLCGSLRTCSQWKHFSFKNWGIHLK